MVKVSVVIPIYNARQCIRVCLDSLREQTLVDVEVILVDDKSCDDTCCVVRDYIKTHSLSDRFFLLEQSENMGPGEARNRGLAQARGEYLAFVDGDDYLEADALELLYNKALEVQADLCFCKAQMEFSSGRRGRMISNPRVEDGEFGDRAKRYYLTHFVTYCWTYLYRREFLDQNKLFFAQGRTAEDSVFLTQCILLAERIASVDKALYHYVVNSGSLTQQFHSDRYLRKIATFDLLMSQTATRRDYAQELEYIYLKKGFLISMFDYVRDNRSPRVEVVRQACDSLQEGMPNYKNNKYLRADFRLRVLVRLLFKMPRFAIFILSLRR